MYRSGFLDALDCEPEFEEGKSLKQVRAKLPWEIRLLAPEEYWAGFGAYWEIRDVLYKPDFRDHTAAVAMLPRGVPA
jgi:hypothetical protein